MHEEGTKHAIILQLTVMLLIIITDVTFLSLLWKVQNSVQSKSKIK